MSHALCATSKMYCGCLIFHVISCSYGGRNQSFCLLHNRFILCHCWISVQKWQPWKAWFWGTDTNTFTAEGLAIFRLLHFKEAAGNIWMCQQSGQFLHTKHKIFLRIIIPADNPTSHPLTWLCLFGASTRPGQFLSPPRWRCRPGSVPEVSSLGLPSHLHPPLWTGPAVRCSGSERAGR